jgi:catechol 2,3-dioxygenase-like lactoylglutathione lyase family enzyme
VAVAAVVVAGTRAAASSTTTFRSDAAPVVARYRQVVFVALLCAATAVHAQSIAGIDHIPTAVRDLDAASARYRALGFALKPGRPHDNSLLNNHAKFPDGTEIELITASEPRDALAARYLQKIAVGDGPAYLAFHCDDFAALRARLGKAGIPFDDRGFFGPADPSLNYLFFVGDNRSPTDKPEHFAHPNTTETLIGVWIADVENPALRGLLDALGAKFVTGTIDLPARTAATLAQLDRGTVTLLPRSTRLIADRPIIGAVLKTRDLKAAERVLKKAGLAVALRRLEGPGYKSIVLPPEQAHGLWLEFRQVQ